MKNSSLHERNIKIHKNLWKVYTFSLVFGTFYILLQGTN